MTRAACVALTGAIMFVAASCGERTSERDTAAGKVRVCVPVPPLAYVVDRIGGERVESLILVPPGRNPHMFEVTPKEVAALSQAHVYFATDMPIEGQILPKLTEINRNLKIVSLLQDIPLRRMEQSVVGEEPHHDSEDEHDTEHHHHHGELDPHVWLSPPLVMKMAQRICDELKSLDAGHAAEYDTGLHQLLEDLNRLDESVREKLTPHRGRAFLVFHPAFGYFADAYGLEQIAIEFEGKEPTARQLASVVEAARLKNIRTIFIQKQFPSRAAQAVARELGASIVELDPLSYDYVENIRMIAQQISESFSRTSP